MGTSYNTNVVSDGLIGCWDAGNRRCGTPSAGGTWTGLGVNAPATLVNQAEFEDISLGAILLDGTDDKVTVANTTDIDGQNGFTFGIWLYFLDTPGNDYTCFSIYNGSAGDVYEFMLYIQDFSVHSKTIMLGTRGHTSSSLRSNNTAMSPSNNIGKWVHYCATYNGDGENTPTNYKIYFNGQDMGSDGTTDFGGGTNAIRWGIDGSGAGDLNGYIGRVAFYNRPLSADEVSQNYEATKSRFEPRITKSGLVANWDAGDPKSYNGGTTTWTDTANGYVGTLQNMEAGDFNLSNEGYLEFDGSDEYVNFGHVGFLSEGTIELWIRYDTAPVEESNLRPWGGNDYFEARHSSAGLGGAISWDISANSIHSVKTSWSTSVWHHQVWTWKYSSTTGSMYFDGELDVTGTIDQDPSALASSNDMYLMRSSSTYAGNINGKLAVFRVYNRALSAAEVLENYQAAKGRFT